MKFAVLDFETYYDDQYSLRKMTPVEYILDPRFEAIGCSVKEGQQLPYWVAGPDLAKLFNELDRDQGVITHNALFDMSICAWRYGFIPKLMVDTLGMSRACLGHKLKSLSLNSVASHLGLGVKGDAVGKVKGMSYAAIAGSPTLYQELITYANNDAELCAGIFHKLFYGGHFPVAELAVMDMILRCAVEPSFVIDQNILAQHLGEVRAKKETLLSQAMLLGADGKSSLMSNEQFASLLRQHGVEPPMKVSPITGKTTYAFAKTDLGLLDLQEHENPAVQALVAARLGHKSTIEETRTERLLSIANLSWPGLGQARLMPVPLKVSGAHTHRMSGDWKLNMQNLPARGGNNAIRRALMAPQDHEVLTVDSSQIEARLVAWLAGQDDLVLAFENKEDIYSQFATDLMGHPVNRKLKDPVHIAEGFVGKTCILGLGYMLGWKKFQARLEADSKNQLGNAIVFDDERAKNTVDFYRRKYSKISGLWRWLENNAIPALAGFTDPVTLGPCLFEEGSVLLPSGLRLWYDNLERTSDGWKFTYGRETKYLYGGKLLENLCQALARIITFDAALRIQKRCSVELDLIVRMKLQVHDENVFVVHKNSRIAVEKIALEEMHRRPEWGPTLPIAAEAGHGPSYGDAK
ncbi:DNA polymerase [Pseudolabrys sp.]|uniref:DNA polymerase n=1 Tax=Pseudolabrys sp. TaxID=1960880 RepID=UPI003D1464CB